MANEIMVTVQGSNKFRPTEVAVTRQINALQKAAESAADSGERLEEILAKPRATAIDDVTDAIDDTGEAAERAARKIEQAAEKEAKAAAKAAEAIERKAKAAERAAERETRAAARAAKAAEKAAEEAAEASKNAFRRGVDGITEALPAALSNPAAMGGISAAAVPLGAIAGGAVVLGFGAGLAGLGIASVAGTREVRSAFADMTDDVSRKWTGVVAPFKRVTADIAGDVAGAFESFRPTLTRTFAALAPDVDAFSNDIFRGLSRFAPALEPLGRAAGAVMRDIGDRFPDIIENVADGFERLAESVERNPEALGQALELAGGTANLLLSDMGALNDIWGDVNQEAEMFANWFEGGDYALNVEFNVDTDAMQRTADEMFRIGLGAQNASRSSYDARDATERLTESWSALADAGDDLAKRGAEVSNMLDILSGRSPTYEESQQAINDSIRELNETFADAANHADGYGNALVRADGVIITTTKNGSDLYNTVQDLQDGFANAAVSVRDLENAGWEHDAAVNQVNQDMRTQYDRLVANHAQMGLTRDQMIRLLDTYGLNPRYLDTMARLDENGVPERLDAMAYTRTVIYKGVLDMSQIPSGRSPDARAHGGISGGGWTEVGEMGRELVKLPPGSQVMPHTESPHELAKAGGGGSGGVATVAFDFSGIGNLSGLERLFFEVLKEAVRGRGGNAEVFG